MEKLDILPTTLYKFKLPDKLLEQTLNMCNNIPWNEQETRGDKIYYGTSYTGESDSLHHAKGWTYLSEWFQKKVNEVKEDIKYTDMEDIRISQMWANRSTLLQWHHLHTHPNSVLSGILYIQGVSGKTWFVRKNNYDVSDKYMVLLPDDGTIIHKIEPEKGTLLIFPSSLAHSVDENKSPIDRITISFNTFFKGKFGKGLHSLNINFD